jgi:CheY-like chemotaxis protein
MLESTTDRPRPIRVLIVEDDADSREMYTTALTFAGMQTHGAADANTAFDLAVSVEPDVIVTDFILSGKDDGAVLCQRIHDDRRTADIKVLVVTGSTRKKDVEALLGAGCSDIRTKPYLPATLVDDIEQLMAPKPSGRPS